MALGCWRADARAAAQQRAGGFMEHFCPVPVVSFVKLIVFLYVPKVLRKCGLKPVLLVENQTGDERDHLQAARADELAAHHPSVGQPDPFPDARRPPATI